MTAAKVKFIEKCQKKLDEYRKEHRLLITYVRKKKAKILERPTSKQLQLIKHICDENLSEKKIADILEFNNISNKVFVSATSIINCNRSPQIGVVVSFIKDKKKYVGWSLCNTSSGEVFNRYAGVFYAIRRAKSVSKVKKEIEETRFALGSGGVVQKGIPIAHSVLQTVEYYVEKPKPEKSKKKSKK